MAEQLAPTLPGRTAGPGASCMNQTDVRLVGLPRPVLAPTSPGRTAGLLGLPRPESAKLWAALKMQIRPWRRVMQRKKLQRWVRNIQDKRRRTALPWPRALTQCELIPGKCRFCGSNSPQEFCTHCGPSPCQFYHWQQRQQARVGEVPATQPEPMQEPSSEGRRRSRLWAGSRRWRRRYGARRYDRERTPRRHAGDDRDDDGEAGTVRGGDDHDDDGEASIFSSPPTPARASPRPSSPAHIPMDITFADLDDH